MTENLLHKCLYFTANRLARTVTKMADDAFRPTGLSPAHAFALMLVNAQPGQSQSGLTEKLAIASSTLTRFIDQLEHRGLVERNVQGKNSFLFPTAKGKGLQRELEKCWQGLYHRYSEILGYKEGDQLARKVGAASSCLEDPASARTSKRQRKTCRETQ
jgi:DNA-binding MarR family transcriptional regulator